MQTNMMEASAITPPQHQSIFTAAQHGDLEYIKRAVESGAARVTDLDVDSVTALHWAAINNRIDICHYLIERGADVDAIGGVLLSTPLHWAVRQGHLYTVVTLLQHNARLDARDSQSFTALHLAAQNDHTMIVLYLLSHGLDVNVLDENKRTPLMWNVYKGYSGDTLSVLLKYGADINFVDVNLCSALHRGALRHNVGACKTLIKAGAKLDMRDDHNQTPLEAALEKGGGEWLQALVNNAAISRSRFNMDVRKKLFYLMPFVVMGLGLVLLTYFDWYIAYLLVGVMVYGCYLVFQKTSGTLMAHETPLLAGVYQSSVFWCCVVYYLVVFPATKEYPVLNMCILFLVAMTVYFCYLTMKADPGFLRCGTVESAKSAVQQLIDERILDRRHFCATCLIRKPIRSKHDRILDRCCARFDHFCPWVNTAIGINNHRIFVIFLSCSVGAQLLYSILAILMMVNLDMTTLPEPALSSSCFLAPSLCVRFYYYTPIFYTVLWCILNGLWECGTLFSQYHLIAVGLTTNESINQYKYEYLRLNGALHNPFDHGIPSNCWDFWTTKGVHRNVNWFATYQWPPQKQMIDV